MFLDFLSYAIAWTPAALFFGAGLAYGSGDYFKVTWKQRVFLMLFLGYIVVPVMGVVAAIVIYSPFWIVALLINGPSYIRSLL